MSTETPYGAYLTRSEVSMLITLIEDWSRLVDDKASWYHTRISHPERVLVEKLYGNLVLFDVMVRSGGRPITPEPEARNPRKEKAGLVTEGDRREHGGSGRSAGSPEQLSFGFGDNG